MKRIIVEKNSYHDSVFLMLINREIKKDTDAKDAVVVMGTEVNVDFLKEIGFSNPELGTATPHDLIIGVDAVDDDAAQ